MRFIGLFFMLGMTTVCFAETQIEGKMKLWYPVIITLDGPQADEQSSTFRNHRLDVTFSQGDRSLVVPGYFAADGDAANTGATSGDKWRVKFTPDAPGRWKYNVSFRVGQDVAASLDPIAGQPGTLDGMTGEFTVEPSDPKQPRKNKLTIFELRRHLARRTSIFSKEKGGSRVSMTMMDPRTAVGIRNGLRELRLSPLAGRSVFVLLPLGFADCVEGVGGISVLAGTLFEPRSRWMGDP